MTTNVSRRSKSPTATSSEEIAALGTDLGLSDAEIAAALGVSPDGLAAWLPGAVLPAVDQESDVLPRLRQLRALNDRLQDTFVAAGVRRWLRQDNRYLSDAKPITLLINGEFDRINDALEALDAGVFV